VLSSLANDVHWYRGACSDSSILFGTIFLKAFAKLLLQDSADGSMVEGGEFAEVVFGQVPGFTAPE